MKIKLIFFLTFLISTVSISQSAKNQFDAQGKRQGKWSKNFDKTSILRYTGEFNNGKEVGVFKFYKNIDNKAVLSATRTFNPDNDIAKVRFFDLRGNIISEGEMIEKTYVGKWTYYLEGSKRKLTTEYFNTEGKLDGERKVYYKDGSLAELSNYKNGLLEGESIWYQEDGKVIRIITYRNNKFHGKFITYDVNEMPLKEGEYKDDLKYGVWKYYKDGKFVKERDFTKRTKQ